MPGIFPLREGIAAVIQMTNHAGFCQFNAQAVRRYAPCLDQFSQECSSTGLMQCGTGDVDRDGKAWVKRLQLKEIMNGPGERPNG